MKLYKRKIIVIDNNWQHVAYCCWAVQHFDLAMSMAAWKPQAPVMDGPISKNLGRTLEERVNRQRRRGTGAGGKMWRMQQAGQGTKRVSRSRMRLVSLLWCDRRFHCGSKKSLKQYDMLAGAGECDLVLQRV